MKKPIKKHKTTTPDDLGRRIKKLEDQVKELQTDFRQLVSFKK